MAASLFYSWKADEDLAALYSNLAERSPTRARTFLRAVENRCQSLTAFPEQGRLRDDLLPGIRILPYARAIVIAYRVGAEEVRVEPVFFAGQDYENLIGPDT